MGYRNANEIRIESALGPLRSRDDFRQQMMDATFPAEPFAVRLGVCPRSRICYNRA